MGTDIDNAFTILQLSGATITKAPAKSRLGVRNVLAGHKNAREKLADNLNVSWKTKRKMPGHVSHPPQPGTRFPSDTPDSPAAPDTPDTCAIMRSGRTLCPGSWVPTGDLLLEPTAVVAAIKHPAQQSERHKNWRHFKKWTYPKKGREPQWRRVGLGTYKCQRCGWKMEESPRTQVPKSMQQTRNEKSHTKRKKWQKPMATFHLVLFFGNKWIDPMWGDNYGVYYLTHLISNLNTNKRGEFANHQKCFLGI